MRSFTSRRTWRTVRPSGPEAFTTSATALLTCLASEAVDRRALLTLMLVSIAMLGPSNRLVLRSHYVLQIFIWLPLVPGVLLVQVFEDVLFEYLGDQSHDVPSYFTHPAMALVGIRQE